MHLYYMFHFCIICSISSTLHNLLFYHLYTCTGPRAATCLVGYPCCGSGCRMINLSSISNCLNLLCSFPTQKKRKKKGLNYKSIVTSTGQIGFSTRQPPYSHRSSLCVSFEPAMIASCSHSKITF